MVNSISPIINPLEPRIRGVGNSLYTWQTVKEYFFAHQFVFNSNKQLPMHYYVEYFSDDYNIYSGCPTCYKSWALEMLIRHKVLHEQYADAILIAVQEDYSMETMDVLMLELLSHNIIMPYLSEHALSRYKSVSILEDLLDWNKIDSMGIREYPFFCRKNNYFNMQQLDLFMKKFVKKRT